MKYLILLLLIPVFSYSQSFDVQKMDSLFSLIESNNKGMGSISIYENGMEVYYNSTGYSFMEDKIKADPETQYRIGSITKTFTAAIILELVEQSKLTLKIPIVEYFPEIENADDITVGNLLRQRSGIFNITNSLDYLEWMEESTTKDSLLARIVRAGVTYEPDTKTEYSNSNYILLTWIAEEASGMSYDELLQKYIFTPCNLKNTSVGTGINPEQNEAYSYRYMKEWQKATETDMSIPLGAGNIVSTASDINSFLSCLFSGKIISDSFVSQMITLKEGYGMGMFQVPFYDKVAYGHTGGIDAFQSNAFYFPEEDVSITYLSNGVVMPINNIVIGALSIYFGKDYKLPEFKEAIELKPDQLQIYEGLYTTPDLPLDLRIYVKDGVLYGQGTGQPAFPLEAYDKDKFHFEQAGVKIQFNPVEDIMILYQGGGEYVFSRSPEKE